MSCSESISVLNTPRELGLRNNMLQDPTSFLSSRTRTSASLLPKANASAASYVEHQQPQWELSADSAHDTSNYDSTNSSHGSFARERSQQASDIEMEKLKSKLVVLTRQQDVSELEIQTLRKQIVKEIKRGRHLSREILGLKGERDMLKSECEKLKAFQKCMEEAKSKNKLPFKCGDPFVEEVRQELNYEKDLNSNLRLQLQKTLETNAELILAVKDLNEMLEQKSRETSDLSNKARSYENAISRRQTCDDEEQKALEELVKEHKDAKETYLLEQKIMDLCSEIEIYRGERDELEMQLEQLALDYEILKQENHDMSYKLEQSQLQEQLKVQYECSPSFPYTNELEAQVESLENELKKQSKENSDCLTTIKELQTRITSLEKELEQQAQEFDADLGVVTSARVEQEQRAIQAEEALRKTKLKNANTAEKLQEEFRRLSIHMASTFDANEKVAMKALAEASELHMQKGKLEEMLQKANEELQSVKDGYESKLHVLSNQLNLKMHQIEQMSNEDKSRQLEQQEKHDEECVGAFSHEFQGLKAELEMLSIENDHLSEQAERKENMRLEVEQMKTSIKHTDALVQKGNMKRNELVSTISLLKKEAEKSQEELNRMRCLKDEKESAMSLLQSEVRMLKAQCDDLKHCLFEDELAKEKLRRQLLQLKSELKKKEDALTSMEKKLKESNKCIAVSEGTKSTMRNNKFAPVPYGSKEMANQRDIIKLLEVQVKLKETSLEASANSFSEKERDLQNKTEELEGRVEELNQNCASFCCNQPRKSSEDNIGITPNGDIAEDLSRDENPSSSTSGMSKENGNLKLSIKSDHSSASELEPKTCSVNNTDHNANEELGELESLKERNKSMENELKEMQERYSEMSLKFAQVEGERQQLVMTLRNLKNATARKT